MIFKNAYISAHMCKPVSSPYSKMLFQSPDKGRDFRHVHQNCAYLKSTAA